MDKGLRLVRKGRRFQGKLDQAHEGGGVFLSGHVTRMPRNVQVRGANCRVQTAGAKRHPGGRGSGAGLCLQLLRAGAGGRMGRPGGKSWGCTHTRPRRRGELLP